MHASCRWRVTTATQVDAVCRLEKRRGDARHVEDFKRPGKECERLRMLRLRRTGLDEPPSKPAAGAFVGEKQPDRPGADNQNIRVRCRAIHVFHHVSNVLSGLRLPRAAAGRRRMHCFHASRIDSKFGRTAWTDAIIKNSSDAVLNETAIAARLGDASAPPGSRRCRSAVRDSS